MLLLMNKNQNKSSGLISFFLLGMLGLATLAYLSLGFVGLHDIHNAQVLLVSKRERGKAIRQAFQTLQDNAGESPSCFVDNEQEKFELCGWKTEGKTPVPKLSSPLLQAQVPCAGLLHEQEQSHWTFQSNATRALSPVASQTCVLVKDLLIEQEHVHLPYNLSAHTLIVRAPPSGNMPIIFISGYAELRNMQLETDALVLVLGDVFIERAYSKSPASLELAALQGGLHIRVAPDASLTLHSFARRGELAETFGVHDHILSRVPRLPFFVWGVFYGGGGS